jgi:hypothetical protein
MINRPPKKPVTRTRPGDRGQPGTLAVRIRAEMEARYRDHFCNLLAKYLVAAPSVEAIRAFAQKHPDRWVHGLAMLARLAGYSDRLEIQTGLVPDLSHLSDAELELRVRALAAEILGPDTGQERGGLAPASEPEASTRGDQAGNGHPEVAR